jgi:PAS domain S-box-containing protein
MKNKFFLFKPDNSLVAKSPKIQHMSTDNKVYNILVIEDNPGDYALVEEFLSEQIAAFTIMQAQSFEETQEILLVAKTEFDVILLDLSLPDKTGLSLVQEIIEMSINTPVIVLTGYADISFSIKSLSMGISDYLLKDDLTSAMLYKSIVYSSERKKTMLALEESQKQYSELFHLSPQPMWVSDLVSMKFLDVNKAAVEHYGYSVDEFLKMTVHDICLIDKTVKIKEKSIDRTVKNKLCQQKIFTHKKKNGEFIQVDIQSNVIEFKSGKAKVTLANDVTERLAYITAIETQNKKLIEISWIQSHLVRAPVARILGLIPLINDMEVNVEEKKEMLCYLLASVNELDELIKGITEKTICK